MRCRIAIGLGGLVAVCLFAALWAWGVAPRPQQDQTCSPHR